MKSKLTIISGLTRQTGKFDKSFDPDDNGEYCIAYMSDVHFGSNLNPANITEIRKAFNWISNHNPKPVACVFCGDLNIGERIEYGLHETADFDNYFEHKCETYEWDPDVKKLVIIGNHDALYGISQSGGAFAPGERPHELIKSGYPDLFAITGGGLRPEWYKWSYRDITIMAMDNLTDTRENYYFNCNPPGVNTAVGENPDYSGFSISGSHQWNWIRSTSSGYKADPTKKWLIGALHRPIYAPYSTGSDALGGRPTHYLARSGVIREAIYNGMSILLQGDQHITFGGKKYINKTSDVSAAGIEVVADTGVGVYPFVVAGGYATRPTQLSYLPGQTLGTHYLFETGYSSQTSGKVVVGMFTFSGGDQCLAKFMQFIESGTELIYSGYLTRNPGLV